MEQTFPQHVDLPRCIESRCTEKNQARSLMTSTHASVRCSILVFTDIHERVQRGRARAAEIGDCKQSDSYTDMYACAPLSVSVTTQNGGRSLEVLRGLVVLIAAPTNG